MDPHYKQSQKGEKEQMTPHDGDERVQNNVEGDQEGRIFPPGAVAGFFVNFDLNGPELVAWTLLAR